MSFIITASRMIFVSDLMCFNRILILKNHFAPLGIKHEISSLQASVLTITLIKHYTYHFFRATSLTC